jgi:hypothetical protein
MLQQGFGFLLATAASIVAQTPLSVAGLGANAPLTIRAHATRELLTVDLVLQPEWHVYANDVGGGQPVTVRLPPDSAFAANGALRLPPDIDGKLTGKVRLELPIVGKGEGAGLKAVLEFAVCDPLLCLPPMEVTIAGEVRGLGVLLVVDEPDARSARIAAFLRARGFTVDVTTYADVTAEQCNRHDVVLADSKLFGKGLKVRQRVREFPRTTSPIVAVGFYGTELIEAHGLAMTSGYI